LISKLTTAEIEAIGWFNGLFCQASMAEKIPTAISMTIPPITIHSPQIILDLLRLKSDKLLCQSFSANRSIKSPTNTNMPPDEAKTITQKNDSVVILLYAILAIVVGVGVIAFIIDYRRTNGFRF
jgi:hypothetical protein